MQSNLPFRAPLSRRLDDQVTASDRPAMATECSNPGAECRFLRLATLFFHCTGCGFLPPSYDPPTIRLSSFKKNSLSQPG